MAPISKSRIHFANLVADEATGELTVDDAKVTIGERAFDILLALLSAEGRVRTKEDLFKAAWSDEEFSENRLQVHISALRKAVGTKVKLETLRGVGYRLSEVVAVPALEVRTTPTNLPSDAPELIGRTQCLRDLIALVADQAVVTLTGTGGIGKTRLALAAGAALLPRFPDGVWLVQLGNISNSEFLLQTFASTLGIEISGDEATSKRVAGALKDQTALIILDNCEHVALTAARLVEDVVKVAKQVRIIVTSREPIQAVQEFVLTVPPLEVLVLGEGGEQSFEESSAISLFVKRTREAQFQFETDESILRDIASICEKLDGLPLAIELAAARAAVLGVKDVLERLNDRFALLTSGRRTAAARHQTLRASVDWSYNLLTEPSRAALRHLGVFAADFTLEAGCYVIKDAYTRMDEAGAQIVDLIDKSFIKKTVSQGRTTYKLLETARAYALEKLAQAGLVRQARERHSQYHRELAERKYKDRERCSVSDWLVSYGARVEDMREALVWAASADGSPELHVPLAAYASVLWIRLNLFEECLRHAQRGIKALEDVDEPDIQQAIQLYLAYGESSFSRQGPQRATYSAYTKALELARQAGDAESQLRALWGQHATRFTQGHTSELLQLGLEFREVAKGSASPSDVLIAERLIGLPMHFAGEHAEGRTKIQYMLDRYVTREFALDTQRFKFDQRMQSFILLSGILWVEGSPEQALAAALNATDAARNADHTISLVQALAVAACPIALLTGELVAAEELIGMLGRIAARHALQPYIAWSRYYSAFLECRRGRVRDNLDALNIAFRELRESALLTRFVSFLGEHIDWMGAAAIDEIGPKLIDDLIVTTTQNGQIWCTPELLRVKAKFALLENRNVDATTSAVKLLSSAIQNAEQQKARCWQLRAAVDLFHLQSGLGREAESVGRLRATYSSFTEGFKTPDMRMAAELIEKSTVSQLPSREAFQN